MKRVTIGLCAATVLSAGSAAIAAECETVIWCDSFDNYTPGILLGQDCAFAGCPDDTVGCPDGAGWQAWAYSGGAGLSPVVTTQANSAPHSVEIVGGTGSGGLGSDDMVHTYRDFDLGTGVYQYSGMCYVPDDATGDSYFILLNTYGVGGATTNWSTQVHLSAATGEIARNVNEAAAGTGEVSSGIGVVHSATESTQASVETVIASTDILLRQERSLTELRGNISDFLVDLRRVG